MKSIYNGKSDLLLSRTTSHVSGRYRRFDDLKERAITTALLTAVGAVCVGAYVIIFVWLYRWSP